MLPAAASGWSAVGTVAAWRSQIRRVRIRVGESVLGTGRA